MAKPSVSLQIKQQQKLTPQQIQFMRLLQLPVQDIDSYIEDAVEKNPVLEAGKPVDTAKLSEQQEKTARINSQGKPVRKNITRRENERVEIGANNASEVSLYDSLREQFAFMRINDTERKIGELIIGNIDEKGYLVRSTDAIADDYFFDTNEEITVEQVENVLKKIQSLDPAGVGARDLKECLSLQIKRCKTEDRGMLLAKKIIDDASLFDLFAKNHFTKLLKRTQVSKEELEQAMGLIRKFDPRPANTDDALYDNVYVTPDFLVWNNDGRIEFELTRPSAPRPKISSRYENMLKELQQQKRTAENREAISFIKDKMDSAKEFLSNLSQRDVTLTNVMSSIIRFQYAYFIDGDISKLKPMRLEDIALMTGENISTISRVARQKYCQTHFGIFLLRKLFTNAVEDSKGNAISSHTVRDVIKSLVDKEDKSNPLTDEELEATLRKEGFPIARRTVAKYRNTLNIPVARLRKKLM